MNKATESGDEEGRRADVPPSARKGPSAIETALTEGLQSGPAEEWTKEEWAAIRQRVIRRRANS
jgi:hypothetical protein